MALSFSDYYGISEAAFDDSGALDPILGIDTRLFIDPALLRDVTTPEFKDSEDRVKTYFAGVLKVVNAIEAKNDRLWRHADELLTFPEVAGLSIGYSSSGTSGSGMGPGLRARLLESIQQIVKAGANDPAIFEMVGIFEDNIGADRISDMIAKIIAPNLIAFTQRVCSDCGIPLVAQHLPQLNLTEDLPQHPYTHKPLLLVPKEILRDLPIAESFADVRFIAAKNSELRKKLNDLVGSAWHDVTVAEQKRYLRKTFVSSPEILQALISAYLSEVPDRYDFENDRSGEVIWYKTSKKLPSQFPLKLSLGKRPTIDDVERVVISICEHFQVLVEDNQLAKLLYDRGGRPKHESAAQLLFFGIASAYCRANDLDLSPESDAGRGPVDFKVSSGFAGKVLVEIKLTSNKRLSHGFESQLPIYQRAEGAQRGVYLVIDNGGASADRIASFDALVRGASGPAPRVIWVDGIIKPSASIADD